MDRNRNRWLFVILAITLFALWIDLSEHQRLINPINEEVFLDRDLSLRLGLDLRGGLQTLLEADLPPEREVTDEEVQNVRNILENRANALGVSEVIMQVAGDRRIVAEFPGVTNPEEVVATLRETALLEFVDMGVNPVEEGSVIQTDFGQSEGEAPPPADGSVVYHTVITGAALESVQVGQGSRTPYAIHFVLQPEFHDLFAEYTASHINQYLVIVLDKQVISVASISQAITGGQGVIEGNFTQEDANALAVQLRSGALPIPMKVVESRTIGPTLGEESVRKSLQAGIIGLIVVALFMAFNYRLPGLVADLALICYALLSIMLFKLIPVVLTLPGIAGFILSIGMAVDANVLIFERLKEELRGGRTLHQAIDVSWKRAWPSIRDSNISTLITCAILFWFGSAFGASMVKGFAVTLALGVMVSLFTALNATRTFLHVVLDRVKLAEHPRWFGL